MKTINFELNGKKYCCKRLNAKDQLKIATRTSRAEGSLYNLEDKDLDYVMGKLLGTVQVYDEEKKYWGNVVTSDTPDYELMDENMPFKLMSELAEKVIEHNFGDFSEGVH